MFCPCYFILIRPVAFKTFISLLSRVTIHVRFIWGSTVEAFSTDLTLRKFLRLCVEHSRVQDKPFLWLKSPATKFTIMEVRFKRIIMINFYMSFQVFSIVAGCGTEHTWKCFLLSRDWFSVSRAGTWHLLITWCRILGR